MTLQYTFLFIFGFVFGGQSTTYTSVKMQTAIHIRSVPYQVSVHDKQALVCGGTILNKDYILTAKSCAKSPATDLKIRAGSYRHSEDGTMKDVTEVRLHTFADLAILKLNTSLELNNSTMSAVELPAEAEGLDIGIKARIVGWGALEERGEATQVQHFAEVEVKSCKIPTSNTLCTETPEMFYGPCKYDVGGALVYNKVAYGVLSQYQCGKLGELDLYTRVAAFKLWIEQNSA